ncbi:GmrSD restriction endonuclease domain-containing protein [Campylobacter troglodytis]|uniref:GmrSD restriction endonuclease domain-containing protein n=1 Tax=Campylobacter troglodytis TaxID=654363 RepID=UPI00163BAE17|nr:DUF262 domain-containing protein [Campylobacter troglodytis]
MAIIKKRNLYYIDGQQRITTLWLLHFYLYKKAKKLEFIAKALEKFSYAVRDSSKNFCKNLLKKDFDLDINPSKAILDKGGEFEKEQNLRNDPTIKAMLNMLDLIYERINNKTKLENFIKNLDNISFYVFDMGKFELGEELYIKMNARGKQLSKCENLKAYIESNSNEAKAHTLWSNIDNKWADMFFDPKNPNAFDKRGIVFLHYANIFFSLLNSEAKNDKIKDLIDSANHAIDDFYKPLQNLKNIELLDSVVDLYKTYKQVFKQSGFLAFSDFDSFKNAKDSLTYTEICYFYATIFLALESKNKIINTQSLEDYLRVCKHLIQNHRLDNDEHITSFFELFKILSKGYNNIYEFLAQNSTHKFHKDIYELESRKAKLILSSRKGGENWEEILNATSKHPILVGWVDYLLDFSYDNTQDFEKFCKYSKLTMQILYEINKDKDQDRIFLPLFQRAFLSVGHYGFWATNYFYGNYCGEIYRDREALNWLLSGKKNDEKKPYFKELLDKIIKSQKMNLMEILQDLINDADLSNKEWYDQLLIKRKGLFEFLNLKKLSFQKTSRIRFIDGKVELLPGIKSFTNVRNLLDYGFYLYCKDKEIKNLSEYESNEEQYGNQYPLQPHFTINDKEVLCDSANSKIIFDGEEFDIDMSGDLFAEFDRIIELIKECLKN